MRFSALDGWRGLFAIVVVLGHFPASLFLENDEVRVAGSVMVDMFFILSGFVVCAGYENKFAQGYSTRRFLLERLGRIYPIHLVMLLAFVLIEVLLAVVAHRLGINNRAPFTGDRTVSAIFTNLALIQSFNIHDTLTWNFPAWSLSTEWAAYILFALAMLARPGRALGFAVLGVISAAVALYLSSDHPMQATYDFGVFRSILGFSLGVVTYYVYQWVLKRGAERRLSRSTFSGLEIVMVILTFALPAITGPTRWQILIPLYYACVILLLAFQGGIVSDFLQTRLMTYLGSISLSIYICHIFLMLRLVNVAEVVEKLTGIKTIEVINFDGGSAKYLSLPPAFLYPLTVGFILLIIAFSHMTYRFVEVPGNRMIRGFAKKLFAKPAVEAAPLSAAPGLTK